jgi:outer membrane protease
VPRLKKLSSQLALLSIPCCIAAAQAGDGKIEKAADPSSSANYFMIGLSVSNFNAKTHELLYLPQATGDGRKISELIYKAENVKLFGIHLEYVLDDTIHLYLGYKKNTAAGEGYTEDFDWADSSSPGTITNASYHDDTDIENVSILDLGIKKSFTLKNINPWVSLGYKQEKIKIKVYDGYGIYFGIPVTFSGLGLTFEQEYKGPYIEIGTAYRYKELTADIGVKYSPLMRATYTDRHHLVPFTETAKFDDTSMVNLNFGASYQITEHHRLGLSYEYTQYAYVRGDRTRTFDNAGVHSWPNSSGIESKNSTLALAYGYRF